MTCTFGRSTAVIEGCRCVKGIGEGEARRRKRKNRGEFGTEREDSEEKSARSVATRKGKEPGGASTGRIIMTALPGHLLEWLTQRSRARAATTLDYTLTNDRIIKDFHSRREDLRAEMPCKNALCIYYIECK
jgi:hypothetical protein